LIRIGPAGIPLSCKGRTNKDGLRYVREVLDLNAMEVQFIRGLFRMDDEEAIFMKEYSKKNDVELHVHAPYYTNLAGDDQEFEMSFEKILKAGYLSHLMGAKILVVHPGFEGDLCKEEEMERIIESLGELRRKFKKEKFETKIGIETMGKQKVFGSLDEVIEVCRKVKGVVPVIDLGHIHARCNGCLKSKEDFENIFAKLRPLRLKHYLIHITGVLYENGNEYYHIPLKKADMPLESLLEILLEKKYNVTLISESPLLEHDATYIRLQLEKLLQKRTGKEEVDFRDIK